MEAFTALSYYSAVVPHDVSGIITFLGFTLTVKTTREVIW